MHHHQDEILEAIWNAQEDGEPTVEAVRSRCPDPISEQDLVLLDKEGLVQRKDHTLSFTAHGKDLARNLIRRHRLAATLLYTVLDLDRDRREEVACEVEHTLVAEVADGICTMLGHPEAGPDGKPIPPGKCCRNQKELVGRLSFPLSELGRGQTARVLFITSRDNERLRRLTSFGLTPGVEVTLQQRHPAFMISFEGTELAIEKQVAHDIHVSPREDDGDGSRRARAPNRPSAGDRDEPEGSPEHGRRRRGKNRGQRDGRREKNRRRGQQGRLRALLQRASRTTT